MRAFQCVSAAQTSNKGDLRDDRFRDGIRNQNLTPNSADSSKGIAPGTSAKVLEARKTAKFKDWSDLIARVSGIGDKRAAKLSAEGLTVNGAKYQPGSAEPPAKAKAKP